MFQKKYDLVVAGGGVAGVAAAVAAARRGAHVALVEKTVLTGGLATTGLIYIYLPLCDGNGTQVSFGITEEMLQKSIVYGPGEIPKGWKNAKSAPEEARYRVIFSPAAFTLSLDEMLTEAGVELWLDTVVTGVRMEQDTIAAVTVYNKSGAGELAASCFIDATGDADLALASGAGVRTAPNAPANWVVEYCRDGGGPLGRDCRVRMVGFANDPKTVERLDGRTVSEFILRGRQWYRELLKKDHASGQFDRTTLYPLHLPAMPQLRTTRCLDAQFVLQSGMAWTHFDDSVGLAADWRKPGFVWEIPYRTLLPRNVKNLLAAGRCTASEGDAWEVTRVIPVAAMTGEAAGAAAALALKNGVPPAHLEYQKLANELKTKCRFALHFEELHLKK